MEIEFELILGFFSSEIQFKIVMRLLTISVMETKYLYL